MSKELISKNPDLLLPEVMNERVERAAGFWGHRTGSLDELDRVTIFVTHRCNLSCQYCNGPHVTLKEGDTARKRQMLKRDVSVKDFDRFLRSAMGQTKIKHVHFTGGEPTLNKDLPRFVEMVTEQGILSSITTNGTAPPELYRELIEKGLTEIRISFDSDSGRKFDAIVGAQGAFEKVMKAIREITRLRDEKKKGIFLVLNACVGEMNLAEIERTLSFLISLSPNDIKLLVVAQDKEFVVNHKNEELIGKLREALAVYPENQFTLLRTKINNLFNPNAVGLKDREIKAVMRHCFIPMTERTIDGGHYYPCSIYLRYYGNPMGPITDSFEEQQEKIMNFVRQHNCCDDQICSNYCTNCCRIFNLRTSQNLFIGTDRIIRIKNEVAEEEIRALLMGARALAQDGQPSARPFLVIKPHGQQWRNEILNFLVKNGLEIESATRIENWPNCAKYLYLWPFTEEEARFTLEMDRAFQIAEQGPADLLRFKNDPPPDSLIKAKLEIRRLFPTTRLQLDITGRTRWIRLTAVHTPNPEDVERENAILNALH